MYIGRHVSVNAGSIVGKATKVGDLGHIELGRCTPLSS